MMQVLLVVVVGIGIAGCDSESSSSSFTGPSSTASRPPPTSSSQTLQSVTLSVNLDAMKSRGDTAQTAATGRFSD